MKWPVGKVYITQKWGVNPQIYKRFGYKGHNGIDLRLFNEAGKKSSTCRVYAPHDGIIKERRFDKDGYGNYLKIENDTEGSILAHLKEFKVNINRTVKEGELVAIGDNTGWSTGPHIHWGYYRLPRDRKNGYGGTIDPQSFINMSDYYKGIDLNNKESIKVCVDVWKDVVDEKYVKRTKLVDLKKELVENDKAWKVRVENEKKQYTDLVEKLASDEYLNCTQQVPDILEQVTRLIQSEDKIAKDLDPKIKDFEKRITDIARVLRVEEDDIKGAIKKIMAGNPVFVNEHSKFCKWLFTKGL